MLPDWVSNPGPLTYESGALPIALCDPAGLLQVTVCIDVLVDLELQPSGKYCTSSIP